MGHEINKIANLGQEAFNKTLNPFSDQNIFTGKAGFLFPTQNPKVQEAAAIATPSVLAAGPAAGSAAGADAAGASASSQGLNPALVGQGTTPGISAASSGAAGAPGIDAAIAGPAFNAGLSPGMQALLAGGSAFGPSFASGAATPAVATSGGAPVSAGSGGTVGAAGTGAAPSAITPPPAAATAAPAGAGSAPSVAGTAGQSTIDKILGTMRQNAGLLGLGISGAGLAMAGKQKPIPNEQQLNDLANAGSQAAKDLITSYRSGQISAAQQASLDQLTQQTKNQINQYFASIGQSDSTAHMQALAQVDQQALGMKQQMLDNMLQQGLQAIGVAQGPLGTIANYQIGQDKNLTDAFQNFGNAVGSAFGRNAGTVAPSTNVTGQTPSTGASQSAPQ